MELRSLFLIAISFLILSISLSSISGPRPLSHLRLTSAYSKRKQVLATFCVTLGCLLNGAVIGYTSPAIPSMINSNTSNVWGGNTPVSFQQTSWVTGILSIGCFIGCVIAGPIMERIGRKKSLMLVAGGFYALGFILISLASHAEFIYAGR